MEPCEDTALTRYNLFAFLRGIGLDQIHLQVLIENGFDSIDHLEPLTTEMAMSIGLKNPKEAATLTESKDSLLKFIKEHGCSLEDALMNYERKVHGLPSTLPLMAQGVLSKKKGKEEKTENFLAKVNHISVTGKGITDINTVKECKKLTVLYAYENKILSMEGLAGLSRITELHLHHNLIKKISQLETMPFLTKLYLSHNCISRLEGLQGCPNLTELSVACQYLPPKVFFTFDEHSLAVISEKLEILDLDECNIKSVEPLSFLDKLKMLKLKGNKIEDVGDLEKALICMKQLETLNVLGNPLISAKKYRDQIVVAAGSLTTLDGKKVTQQERDFILALRHKKKTAKIGSKEEQKVAQGPQPLTGKSLSTKHISQAGRLKKFPGFTEDV